MTMQEIVEAEQPEGKVLRTISTGAALLMGALTGALLATIAWLVFT